VSEDNVPIQDTPTKTWSVWNILLWLGYRLSVTRSYLITPRGLYTIGMRTSGSHETRWGVEHFSMLDWIKTPVDRKDIERGN